MTIGMETVKRLQGYLSQYHRKYPNAWKQFDEFRALKSSNAGFDWQEWCFCPLGAAHAVISQAEGIAPLSIPPESGILGGLAAWRATQGIYCFDETVFEAVWQTAISGEIPVEILYHLPEWCLYIETPGKFFGNEKLDGFFVYLNYDRPNNQDELRFVFDVGHHLIPFPLHLSKLTVWESLQSVAHGLSYNGEKLNVDPIHNLETWRELKSAIEPLLSLTLYICTQLSEIPDFENRSPPNYNPKKRRIYPPEKPLVWDVAYRLGAAIREAEHRETNANSFVDEKRRPRPHIRRAHWHGFWVGAKQEKQKFELKWLPPTSVNVTSDNPVIPTSKKVKYNE